MIRLEHNPFKLYIYYMNDEQIRRQIIIRKRRKARQKRLVVIVLAIVLAVVDSVFLGKAIGNKIYEKEIATYSVVENVPIVETAMKEIGNEKGEKFWSWYPYDFYVPWCACFVSWCENECGYLKTEKAPKFAGCGDGVRWFKSHNQWIKAGETPKGGDIVFFDWDNDHSVDHVGIVTGVVDDLLFTIEGNSSDRCRQKRYELDNKFIMGYGHII